MNAHNDVKRFDLGLDARLVLAAAQLRVVAWVDFLVARWLARCATNVEAAQVLFPDRKLMPWSDHAVRSVQ
jgi:hypothetical protein